MRATLALEALRPELRPYYCDGWLHHPLYVGPVYDCVTATLANNSYLARAKLLTEHSANPGDGWQYILLHEKPYRFDALRRIAPRLPSVTYWKLVGDVWTDSENIRQHFAGWQRVWSDSRPHKQECMSPEERAELEALPAQFPIWRGVGFRGRARGLSWTLDRDKAVWFARRFRVLWGDHSSRLVHAEVERRHVYAFFASRKESEVVASEVKILRIDPIR